MNKKKIIYCSFTATGNEDAVTYLKENFDSFIRILIKFHHSKNKEPSRVLIYEKNVLKGELVLPCINTKSSFLTFFLMPLIYCVHLYSILKACWLLGEKQHLFIGLNFFCALAGIIAKKLGFVEKTIYWIGDYFPVPEKGFYRYITPIWQKIDKFCLSNADVLWFMTKRQFEIRSIKGILKNIHSICSIVPSGIALNKIRSVDVEKVEKNTIVFLGVIGKLQGLDLLIDALEEIIKIHSFKAILKIIGSGPYESKIKERILQSKIEKYVKFYGNILDEEMVREIISVSTVAVAPYIPDKYGFSQFADSGKAKVYLSCGIPLIITNVPYISEEIAEYKAGYCINYSKDELVNSLLLVLNNRNLQAGFKKNAIILAKKYSTVELMNNTLLGVLA